MNLATICLICFFFSGLSSLSYELSWTRLLKNSFGSDALAVSSILAVFIAGLALGAYLAAKNIKLIKRIFSFYSETYSLILSYACLELIIASYALAVPLLFKFQNLSPLIFSVKIFTENFLLFSFAKFILLGLILIIPTTAMGMTFPILSEALAKASKLNPARLYMLNSLGAFLGCLITGFYLLPSLGISKSILLASTINLVIFIVIIFSYKLKIELSPFGAQLTEAAKEQPLSTFKAKSFKLLSIVFITGFVSFSLEVIWTKLLSLILGSSAYSFSIILSAVLLSIALGSYLINRFYYRINDPNKLLVYLLIALALSIFLSSSLWNELPWLFLNISQGLWLINNLAKFIICTLVIMPSMLISSAIFTLVLNILNHSSNDYAEESSKVYYINTIGAILGSLSTGFILIPALGQQDSAAINITKILIIVILITVIYYRLKPQTIITSVSIILISLIYIPALDPQKISSGVNIYQDIKYHKKITKGSYEASIKEPILFYEEGINALVTVSKNSKANAIYLKTNGKVETGMPIHAEDPSHADMLTQILLAQLAYNSEKSLLIGLGGGITFKQLLKSPQLKNSDAVEIENAVIKAAKEFFLDPNDLVQKKSIYKIHNQDARSFLALRAADKYDTIISQPSEPWISNNLFTKEFYELAAQKLESQDSKFIQWLQLYSISPDYLASAIKTFKEVFPETYVFRPGLAGEIILVGSKSKIDFKNIPFKGSKALAQVSLNEQMDLLSHLILVPSSVSKLIKQFPESKINTDDNMLLEFHTPKKITEFYKSIEKNSKLLTSLASGAELISELKLANINELARKHLQLVYTRDLDLNAKSIKDSKYLDDTHGKLAYELASQNRSDLVLYEIYKQLKLESLSEKHLKSAFSSAQNSFERALSLKYQAKTKEALKLLNTELRKKNLSNKAKLYKLKASILIEDRTLLNEALSSLKKALKLDSFNPELWSSIANIHYLRATQIETELKDQETALNQAIKAYKMALSYNPNFYSAHYNLARIYESTSSHRELARHYYSNAIKIKADLYEAHYKLSQIEFKEGSLDLAYKHSKEIVKVLFPNSKNQLIKEELNSNLLNDLALKINLQPNEIKKSIELYNKLYKLIKGLPLSH